MSAPLPQGFPEGAVLVTGGAGFVGCNLADRIAGAGREVIVLDDLSRAGVSRNLDWLVARHPGRVRAVVADIRDGRALEDAADGAGAAIHLAAQVAVTTSLADPVADFGVNAAGTLALLEALRRRADPPPLVFASTNKVYGDFARWGWREEGGRWAPADPRLAAEGAGEDQPLDLHTPYGCSKGVADQYVLDYARQFGLTASVLRMSCIYGPRQFGTEDQGWVAHFLLRMLRGEAITLYGDGRQVRDVCHVADAVDAYLALLAAPAAARGRAFNLGGGPANAVSLLELLEAAEALLGRPARLRHEPVRAGDQRWFVADTARLRDAAGWRPRIGWRDGLRDLAAWLETLSARPDEETAA
ncbi:CDP-paratose 2-epimerase [Hasllibacter halocynthiae]|uniref:CDP-paratose 2-epimerase n=1 Tax=Hasllibacter halocynthiae TaxID=595589 RepID=A0A2T0X943_9RHOB|nr:NAD-dependent epimerase/dehydratase family protein [Hasllibacter halocynthiae]PRY95468.1 CDP-paratose 2-epimerase [Hasllibacter halocynthiae]